MSNIDPTLIILLVLAGLGLISNNMTVTLAILFLTVGVMAPIASGKISANDVLSSFLNWKSLLAIVIGILVSWLGSRGVTLMSNQPSTVAGLLVGTIIGVALFRGVPVGPLIAAGILSLLVGKM